MTQQNLEFSALETQIDNIIKSHQQLVTENHSLKNELAVLREKNQKANALLQQMINKLQDELACRPK